MSDEAARRGPLGRWARPVAVLAIGVTGALLRLVALSLRAPHHDEGVNGWFVEHMLRDGTYKYDPQNYHGPSYFYLLAATRKLLGFGLWQLRLPGALLGLAACFAPLLLRKRLGWPTALAACGLLAVSPTMVYFARYAIHETLLAGLGLVVALAVLRWSDHGRAAWLVLAGAALAAMVATKETTILFLTVSGLWLLGETAIESVRGRRLIVLGRAATWSWRVPACAAVIVAVMAAIHVVAFTGAFQAPGATSEQLARSLRAYMLWTKTGVEASGHDKPACYYLHLGARYELVLYLLALVGLGTGWRDRAIRGLAVVGFGLLGAYSAIGYKMPWLPMSWLALLAIPAAHGVAALGRRLAVEVSPRLGGGAALVLALVPALVITARSSFVRPSDHLEDLAYVHTSADYNQWFPLVAQGARARGRDRLTIGVDVGATWPLAWSLMRYPGTGWSVRGDEDLAIVSVDRAAAVEARLGASYFRRTFQLRDSAPAVNVYLRRRTYGPLLDARAQATYAVVGPTAGRGLAVR